MGIMLATLAFAVAALAAATMGYAIQRGATCTVAAMEEVFVRRRAHRLLAMLEAAFWVAGGLVVLRALGITAAMPQGYAAGAATVAGGLLLGLGAQINGACLFGAVARLGSGEWAYAATPVGFFLGCLGFGALAAWPPPAALPGTSAVLLAPGWVAVGVAGLLAWRAFRLCTGEAVPGGWRQVLAARVWSPHAATVVIALAFLVMLLVAGAWTYTDLLMEAARGMAGSLPARLLLLAALVAGAVLGGWTAGRLNSRMPRPAALLRCLLGGAMMAAGAQLAPGGNDGLILLAMPLFFPYAWVAFAAMIGAISLARLARG